MGIYQVNPQMAHPCVERRWRIDHQNPSTCVTHAHVQKIRYSNNGDDKSPKPPFPLKHLPSPVQTPIAPPTPLTTPNGIRIQSADLPQYTFPTDRHIETQTDRWDRRQVYSNSAYAPLIVSYSLITNTLPYINDYVAWRKWSVCSVSSSSLMLQNLWCRVNN